MQSEADICILKFQMFNVINEIRHNEYFRVVMNDTNISKMYFKMMMIPSLSKVPHWVGSDEGRCGAGWGRSNYVQAWCGEGGYDWYGDVDGDDGDGDGG